MSNKAKKAKQAKARKQHQTKQLNRVRGQVKNFNLTDQEAAFYQRALANKDTPVQFVQTISAELKGLLKHFGLIAEVAQEAELMEVLAQGYPVEAESIKNAAEYTTKTEAEVTALEEKYTEEFKDMDSSQNSYLMSSPAMEEFANIQNEIADNSTNLVTTMQYIIEVYKDLELKSPGEENDNI